MHGHDDESHCTSKPEKKLSVFHWRRLGDETIPGPLDLWGPRVFDSMCVFPVSNQSTDLPNSRLIASRTVRRQLDPPARPIPSTHSHALKSFAGTFRPANCSPPYKRSLGVSLPVHSRPTSGMTTNNSALYREGLKVKAEVGLF
jgi:hypothetical protein